jgi:hypothetical protein
MAIASFRSFVGVAKDTINATLAANIAAGVTSVTVNNVVGTPTTGMSMVIVDGYLTETVTVSAYTPGTPGTLTTSATANAHSANVYCYLQLTSAIGPTAYISVNSMDFADDYVQLYDKGFRGSQADIYGAQQGTRVANISLAGNLFPDTFGYLLSSFHGAYDYTATSGINPTSYAFSPLNTGNGQPASILIYDYNPAGGAAGQSTGNTRVYANCVVSDLGIKFSPGALVDYTATAKSFASGIVANPGTIPPTFTSFTPLPARTATVSIGGTITAKVESADYTFKRQAFGEIFTLQGIQDPLDLFGGPVAVSAKATLVVDDDVQLNNYIQQSQPSFTLTARIGQGTAATDNGITIQCSKANYEQVKVMQHGKPYVTLELPFQAIANSSDKSTAGGGLSPALVTLSTKNVGTSTLY